MIGQFTLHETIGMGSSATVKVATCADKPKTKYAAKLIQLENPKTSQYLEDKIRSEIEIQSQLNNQHIIKLVGSETSTLSRNEDGSFEKVGVIFSEYAPYGNMFDIIKNGGGLGAEITRYYARQLVMAIHHIHTEGYAHKDIKLENILLDKAFNAKITDFGLSTEIEGSDRSGFERTVFGGSRGYMAPEIIQKVPYSGQVVDLFAFGVLLFTMYAGVPPFANAEIGDPHYKLLAFNKTKEFWAAHAESRPTGFFSDSFKDLITSMLSYAPYMRPCLADVCGHSWFLSSQVATVKQVRAEMKYRHKRIARSSCL